jgi:endonuclease-3
MANPKNKAAKKETRPNKKATPNRTGKSSARRPKGSSRNSAFGRGANPQRVKAILQALDEAYPAATCALTHENAFQLLISTILSAQCTDERVNMVTPGLFKKYPTPAAFAYANPNDIEQEIRSTGFYRNKTKSRNLAAKCRERWSRF